MRYLLAFMIFILLAAGCQQASTQTAGNQAKNTAPPAEAQDDAKRISLKDAKEAVDAGKAVIVDARAVAAYQNERIKGSISMPVDEIESRYGELPKNKQLIFYCS